MAAFQGELKMNRERRFVPRTGPASLEVDALKRLRGELATQPDVLLPSLLDKAFKGEL
jgi:hypothetical protein